MTLRVLRSSISASGSVGLSRRGSLRSAWHHRRPAPPKPIRSGYQTCGSCCCDSCGAMLSAFLAAHREEMMVAFIDEHRLLLREWDSRNQVSGKLGAVQSAGHSRRKSRCVLCSASRKALATSISRPSIPARGSSGQANRASPLSAHAAQSTKADRATRRSHLQGARGEVAARQLAHSAPRGRENAAGLVGCPCSLTALRLGSPPELRRVRRPATRDNRPERAKTSGRLCRSDTAV